MPAENHEVVLGVDVGGTFTDLAQWDGTSVTVGKTPSTTQDQSVGVVAGSREVVPEGSETKLVHGTTVATNALLERRGAKTLLLTDEGFEGVLEIARQDRPSLYDVSKRRSDPLVSVADRVGLVGLDTAEALVAAVEQIVNHVNVSGIEAIAVCLLYSYADPSVEQSLAAELRSRLAIPVSVSNEVVAEFREYERMSTTVLNAFLAPEVELYMTNLQERSADSAITDEISVMRSSGGLMSLDSASALSSSILLSGPAGGVVATAALGNELGADMLISFDMGGTSSDVCRIEDGRPEVTYRRSIEGHACMMPSVDVHTVGAGGGSIAWADSGGALRVGPRSAGAQPGPACYGRGGAEPTVTDANLVLGRLDPDGGLAGGVTLDLDASMAAFATLGETLGLDPIEAAQGVLDVVESHMTRAVRTVSIEQGTDPREAVLVAFGGAGGLHATALGRELGVRSVVIPPFSGVYSAFGLLLSAPRIDLARTVNLDESNVDKLDTLTAELLAESKLRLESDSGGTAETVERIVDMRYVGQAHETPTPYHDGDSWDDLVARFTGLHVRQNGFSQSGSSVEVVTIRAAASGHAALNWSELPDFAAEGEALNGERDVIVGRDSHRATVWNRQGLAVGTRIEGPAIIEENESTTYVGPGELVYVHETGALKITWEI